MGTWRQWQSQRQEIFQLFVLVLFFLGTEVHRHVLELFIDLFLIFSFFSGKKEINIDTINIKL